MTIKKPLLIILLTLILALSGCSRVNLSNPTLISSTRTIAQTSAQMPTNSPIGTPTPTDTPVPTLSPNVAYSLVNDFLTNRSECRLPCWLGITPGTSMSSDVQEKLKMFSSILKKKHYDLPTDNWVVTNFTIDYTNNDMDVEISSTNLVPLNGNKISANGFATRSYRLKNGQYNGDVYDYAGYNQLLKAYTISEILSNYGPPGQVYIRSNLSTNQLPLPPYSLDTFVIHIWYPDQGIFMEYSMLAGGSGDTYSFCPSNSIISGVLLPNNPRGGYQEILKKYGGVYTLFFPPAANVKTIEEAVGMTSLEFHQIFRSPTDRCLETPKAIWWPK
jgi:hypothetical protein